MDVTIITESVHDNHVLSVYALWEYLDMANMNKAERGYIGQVGRSVHPACHIDKWGW